MSSKNPGDAPFIVHSTPPNATNPYKEPSPIAHSTELYDYEPGYLPETNPYTTEDHDPILPPWSEPVLFGISLGISREIPGLNCTEWTVLLHRFDAGAIPETEVPTVCRAYTIESGPKDGFGKEYRKHFRIDKPLPSLDTNNNSSSAYQLLIPCGTLHREHLPLFDKIFWKTPPGPNNYFILRFLRILGVHWLVCEDDILMALEHSGLEKRYNTAEIEYFGRFLTVEDENYYLGFTGQVFCGDGGNVYATY